MLQLLRLSALVTIVYVAQGAFGNSSTTAALGSLDPETATCHVASPLQKSIEAVDQAEAILIANGEMYFGQTSDEIKEEIAALPEWDDYDGESAVEVQALIDLLQLGRQLVYAIATEELERQIDAGPEGIRVASADDGISFEMLEALRGGC